jgi:hypothetical protein
MKNARDCNVWYRRVNQAEQLLQIISDHRLHITVIISRGEDLTTERKIHLHLRPSAAEYSIQNRGGTYSTIDDFI